ncbi:hypothetical protein VOLCADRAFT_107224 [Volvox carteri f. nagariensis]|uniref:Uncharacterized protein n=1 Tax=Volvox carteri f. nagariensis TaxID=3068 RepID=D8UCQ1_VOLCA|nr:uncharacterized protein VOLCADRAFT_107224 [Volvox carteri f. nagariensis]EFJ42590.1 hypothetical protein VOLCADRAFT_107224 [Volvox carteri f. nagariensis]|eukprot:XP_002956446.1 hypothetical protein VOLCADRAFT_107224 [Volvox carteri f. nagariensis]
MPTIREALAAVRGETEATVAPILQALQAEGFDVDAEAGDAFCLLDVNYLRSHLNLRQLTALKAAIKSADAGTSNAAAGAPAPRRLVDSVAELHYNNDIVELHFSDSKVSYVDVAGVVVNRIRLWAKTAMLAAVEKHRARAPSILLVSGLVKTGKSFTLEHVVPAVVAELLRKQGEKGPLAGMDGAKAMLQDLLGVLLRWARNEHVPMREGALEAAEDVQDRTHLGTLGHAILEFLEAVEVPVLVLCDEVQSLFMPTINGKLDMNGAAYIRDTFMKQLLVYGSHTMLWCMTGSSMAQTWISLADMPPNGYMVITSASAVNLPASYRPEHMSLVWELLKGSHASVVTLDPRLLELCPPSIALLTVLVGDWINAGCPEVAAFVPTFMRTKLIDESLKEWKLGLEGMPLSQRITVLDLAFPDVGARIDTDLHSGLQRFLAPYLVRKNDGCYYFRDAHQRQIVQLLINEDGTLRESWSSAEFSASLMQKDTLWNLLRLGESADYLLGPHASRRWECQKPPAGMDEFKANLQAIADKTATKLASDQGGVVLGPQELWERQSWFQKVLSSKWNDRDRAKSKDYKQARCTHLAMLVFYLRLSRNILVHGKPWDQEHDIRMDVIEVLPRVLGQSLSDFNQDIAVVSTGRWFTSLAGMGCGGREGCRQPHLHCVVFTCRMSSLPTDSETTETAEHAGDEQGSGGGGGKMSGWTNELTGNGITETIKSGVGRLKRGVRGAGVIGPHGEMGAEYGLRTPRQAGSRGAPPEKEGGGGGGDGGESRASVGSRNLPPFLPRAHKLNQRLAPRRQ